MGRELVSEMLANASSYGLNVGRVYAHTSDPQHPFLARPPSCTSLYYKKYKRFSFKNLGFRIQLVRLDPLSLHAHTDSFHRPSILILLIRCVHPAALLLYFAQQ